MNPFFFLLHCLNLAFLSYMLCAPIENHIKRGHIPTEKKKKKKPLLFLLFFLKFLQAFYVQLSHQYQVF